MSAAQRVKAPAPGWSSVSADELPVYHATACRKFRHDADEQRYRCLSLRIVGSTIISYGPCVATCGCCIWLGVLGQHHRSKMQDHACLMICGWGSSIPERCMRHPLARALWWAEQPGATRATVGAWQCLAPTATRHTSDNTERLSCLCRSRRRRGAHVSLRVGQPAPTRGLNLSIPPSLRRRRCSW